MGYSLNKNKSKHQIKKEKNLEELRLKLINGDINFQKSFIKYYYTLFKVLVFVSLGAILQFIILIILLVR